MVELRWAVPQNTSTEAARLQYRQCGEWPAGNFDGWMDVPWVAVASQPQPPTSVALAFPVKQ